MNDDVVTPTKMTGKKVLPILEMDGEAMGESLDIVAKIDAIGTPILAKAADRQDINQWLKDNKDLMRTRADFGWLCPPFCNVGVISEFEQWLGPSSMFFPIVKL